MSDAPGSGLPVIPRQLLLIEAIPPSGVFFDTNAARTPAVQTAIHHGRAALISSMVYAELSRKRPTQKGLEALDDSLLTLGVRVVPFDAQAARCFFDLCRRLRFDSPPVCRENENQRQCFDRLRFDLVVFAAALAWRGLLVTDNHKDFDHFPFKTHWAKVDDFCSQPTMRP